MIRKGMKLYSILFGACPKCHKESMYTNTNPYRLSEVLSMNKKCSHCDFKYEMEPFFFYGSMYVSYGIGVAVAIIAFVVSYSIFNSSLLTAFFAIVFVLTTLIPVIMRLSRNVWINLFVSYDKLLK